MPLRSPSFWLLFVLSLSGSITLHRNLSRAQEGPAGTAKGPLADGDDISQFEARLADRYDRLELLVARLAELSGSTQPRRAALLRQLVAQSRDRDVAGQFDRVVAALEQES